MKILISCLILLTASFSSNSQNVFINKYLKGGDYKVGFRRIWETDPSRIWERSNYIDSMKGHIGRPIRIDVWYPAVDNENDKMLFREYVYPNTESQEFEDLNFLTERWDVYSYKGLAEDSLTFEKLMNTRISVLKDALPVNKKFPLVVYSAGWFNRSPDNTVLAEYLASHGFVVATIPQLNPGLWTWNFSSDFRSIENQTRDLEFALGRLVREPNVNRTRIAAIGYSTGGDVALLLQGRNKLIDCVIGMDASWSVSEDNDVLNSPFFDAEEYVVPILVLRRRSENEKSYNGVVDSLIYAQRYIIEFDEANHGSFSDDPALRELLGIRSTSSSKVQALIEETILAFLNYTFTDPTFDFAKKMNDLRIPLRFEQKKYKTSDDPKGEE